MTTSEQILVRALEIVEQGWTQATYARDSAGLTVQFDSPEACAWCSLGAVHKATNELDARTPATWKALKALRLAQGGFIPIFNDSHTKAEVVAAFKAAIEATKGNQHANTTTSQNHT